MRVAGIAVEMPTPKRPTTRIVVVEDAAGATSVTAFETFPSRSVPVATQLHEAAEAVRSRLTGLAIDRVVVRRADRPPKASNMDGPRLRLLTEGAVTSAARSVVVETRIGTGKETGAWFGSSKQNLDQAARGFLGSADVDLRFSEAAGAALAGLSM